MSEAALRDTHANESESVEIAILAKAPQPGLAKTRLIPALGARGAARLQRDLTLRTLHTARHAGVGPVTLWCAPDAGHRFFRALQHCTGIECRDQPDGDLGRRMLAAFEWHCPRGPLLLVGTDCPALSAADLQRSARALHEGRDAVLIPAEDGGYVLIGLRRPLPALFEGVAWSSERVLDQTRARLRGCGVRWHEAAPLWDVDRPDDLARLQALHRRGDEPRTSERLQGRAGRSRC